MRIMHFMVGRCDPGSASGVSQVVYHLSRHQSGMGNTVAIFALDDEPPIPIEGVELVTYPHALMSVFVSRQFLEAIRAWKPDIVHLHSSFTPETAIVARWLYRHSIPYVKSPHGNLSPHTMRKKHLLKSLYHRFVQKPYLNRSQFIHAISDQRDIQQAGLKPPIVQAPNGFDLATLPAQPDPGVFFDRYPHLRGKRLFMFVGRLEPYQKGLDYMIQGFGKASNANCSLALVGPDKHGKQAWLQQLADKGGVGDRVIFTGGVYGNDKFHFLAAADIFVHTSRWEGGSLSIIEAAAMGLPLFVTHGADPTGAVEKYHAGLTVDFDVKQIAEGFSALAHCAPEDLRHHGENARRMVDEEFNWTRSAEILVEGYKRYVSTTP